VTPMHRTAITCLALCVLALGACVDRSQPPTTPDAAEKPDELAALVPEGWSIETVARGRLDGDTLDDAAVTLHQSESPTRDADADVERSLLVLVRTEAGSYRTVELLRNVLPCTSCLGMLGAADAPDPIAVLIEDRRIKLGWIGGSRDSTEVSLELALDDQGMRLLLMREELIRTDRALGKETRTVRDLLARTESVDGATRPLDHGPSPAAELSAAELE